MATHEQKVAEFVSLDSVEKLEHALKVAGVTESHANYLRNLWHEAHKKVEEIAKFPLNIESKIKFEKPSSVKEDVIRKLITDAQNVRNLQ